ncbi:MAG: hypothetical protein ABIB43_00760 [archaeon]
MAATKKELTYKEAKKLVNKVMDETKSFIIDELEIIHSATWNGAYKHMDKIGDNIDNFVQDKLKNVKRLSEVSDLYFKDLSHCIQGRANACHSSLGSTYEDLKTTLSIISSHYR